MNESNDDQPEAPSQFRLKAYEAPIPGAAPSEPAETDPEGPMEPCAECSKLFAVVHIRQLTSKRGGLTQERRVCPPCEARINAKKAASVRSGVKTDFRMPAAAVVGLMFFLGYVVCFLWNPGDLRGKLFGHGSSGTFLASPVELPTRSITLDLQSDVLFDFGSAAQKNGGEESLQKIADTIRQYPTAKVLVQGYTDSVGSEAANLTLSTKRAEAIRDWLVKTGGIPTTRISVQGMGSKNPIAPNANPDGSDNVAGREKNRRVTVTLSGVQTEDERPGGLVGHLWRVLWSSAWGSH